MSANHEAKSSEPQDKNLAQRAEAAAASMNTALMAGIALGVISFIALVWTKWF